MRYTDDALRIIEGRFDEIHDHLESRSIARSEGPELGIRTEKIELVTDAGQELEFTIDKGAILIQEFEECICIMI